MQKPSAAFEKAEAAASGDVLTHTLGGRLRAIRTMGKLAFAHIEDGTGRIQLFLRVNELGEGMMAMFKDLFDIGDFIQASGDVVRTRTGEVSLQVKDFKMLAKADHPAAGSQG